jgi:hypothetical protein
VVFGFEPWPDHDAFVVRTQGVPLEEDPLAGQRASGLYVQLWVVPLSGQPARRIIRFADPERQMHRPEFAIWGDRLYLTIGVFQSDVAVMERRDRE